MLEMLFDMVSGFVDADAYEIERWEGTERKVLVVDADAIISYYDADEFVKEFIDLLDEIGEAELFDEFILYEFPTFDVVVMGDCIH